MPTPLRLPCLLSILALLVGCDLNPDTDNGHVTVYNHTDQSIVVHYDQEQSDCCGVGIHARHKTIAAGDDAVIFVDSAFWDGDISVEYDGHWQTYDLDFSILGFETVHVYPEDFAAVHAVVEPPIADG